MAVYDINDFKVNKHSKLRKFRKVLWLFFAVYVVIYFIMYHEDYSLKSLQRSIEYVALANNDEHIGDDISVTIDRTTIYDIFQNGFVTLDKDVLTYINAASRVDVEIPYAYQNPDIAVGKNQIITFDRQGYEFSSSNSFGETFSTQTSSKILDVSISPSDYFSVLTDEASYISALTVYNNSNKEIFKWSTSTYNVVSSIIDSSGDNMIALCIYQEDATIKSKIVLFDISKKEISAEVEFQDSIPIDASFFSNGNISVIFSDSICILDSDLQTLYSKNTANLYAYNVETTHNMLYATDDEIGVLITVLNSQGQEVASKTIDYTTKAFAMSNDAIYILTANYVYKYDLELNLIGQIYTETNIMGIICDNNTLYGIYSTGIKRLF
ncbi:MAG: DUF5711 family protein [Clostridia bacterium]